MDYKNIEVDIKDRVATVWLNRPEKRNALNGDMISEISHFYNTIDEFPNNREDFRVGELLVGILNYTKTLEIGGVKEFIINVKSEWSGTISNVYGTVEIDGKEFKTTPVDLETFQTGKLVAYVNTDDFEPKIYNGKITLLYGEDRKTTVEDITVTFIEAPEEQKQTEFNMMYAVVIVLVIIIFILLFLFLRKSGSQGRRRR